MRKATYLSHGSQEADRERALATERQRLGLTQSSKPHPYDDLLPPIRPHLLCFHQVPTTPSNYGSAKKLIHQSLSKILTSEPMSLAGDILDPNQSRSWVKITNWKM